LKTLKTGSFFIILLQLFLTASEYKFDVICQKKDIYIGEKFKVEYRFSFKDEKKIAEVNFSPPLFNNLHIDDQNISETKNSQSWIYTLSAYKDKNISITSAYLDVAIKKESKKTLGNFDEYDYDYLSLESKPLEFKVVKKAIKTKLFGNFDINSSISKKDDTTELSIKITGDGNFQDIGGYKLSLKNATVYEDKPTVGKNSFLQKFVIISDESFTIPSFEITYTDKQSKKIIKKQTKPIFVKISAKKEQVKQPPKKEQKEISVYKLVFLFIAGILTGYLISKIKFKTRDKKDKKLYEKIKNAKDKKEILNILLAYSHDKKIKKLIKELEDDLYISKENKLRKKDILKRV